MSIKNEQFLKELQPFMRMTVIPGVTVGDLGFSSAQSIFSTGYIATTGTDNFGGNRDLDLFQAAIGDNGQGLAAGQVMTRGQTNWLDTGGKLPANEVFVGIRCAFSVYRHDNSDVALTAGASFAATGAVQSSQVLIPSVDSLYMLLKEFSWEYQTGDGIIRNSGALAGYPQAGGVWEPPTQFTTIGAQANPAIGAQNGYPCATVGRDLPIPFIFLPNINTRVKIKSGTALTTQAGTFLEHQFLAIRQTIQGYKLTMPV